MSLPVCIFVTISPITAKSCLFACWSSVAPRKEELLSLGTPQGCRRNRVWAFLYYGVKMFRRHFQIEKATHMSFYREEKHHLTLTWLPHHTHCCIELYLFRAIGLLVGWTTARKKWHRLLIILWGIWGHPNDIMNASCGGYIQWYIYIYNYYYYFLGNAKLHDLSLGSSCVLLGSLIIVIFYFFVTALIK